MTSFVSYGSEEFPQPPLSLYVPIEGLVLYLNAFMTILFKIISHGIRRMKETFLSMIFHCTGVY